MRYLSKLKNDEGIFIYRIFFEIPGSKLLALALA
jgi:hypothetical protein